MINTSCFCHRLHENEEQHNDLWQKYNNLRAELKVILNLFFNDKAHKNLVFSVEAHLTTNVPQI